MNVYSCWHRGAYGFTLRTVGTCWLFVPDLGQPGTIRRNLRLTDLRFINPAERRYEMERENQSPVRRCLHALHKLFGFVDHPATIGGLLFISA